MSVTNPDKVVTKQDLTDFYNKIFPYLGGMPEMVANKFSKSDIYSTTEKMIGQWIDGLPLYERCIEITMPTVTTQGTMVGISIDISSWNIKEVVSIDGCFHKDNTSVQAIPLNSVNMINTNMYGVRIYVNSTNTLTVDSNYTTYNGRKGIAIVKYTKATDSAISIGNETDYSTTEKIVGTWIDSKPIYQKTIPITIPTCTTDGTEVSASFAIGASIDTVVDVNAWFVNGAKVSSIFTVTGASTKYVRILVQTNAYATAADRNKLRISNASKSASGCTGYATIQYTKTT
jgi:hypothetical protein